MLYIHEENKITNKKLAKVLKCSERTIYRNICSELKEEKDLLNKQL
jgi:transcriptional antiterminator